VINSHLCAHLYWFHLVVCKGGEEVVITILPRELPFLGALSLEIVAFMHTIETIVNNHNNAKISIS